MRDPIDANTGEFPGGPAPAAASNVLSKRQIKAAALSNERLTSQKWKGMLPDARALWTKVAPEDLAKVNGNIHVLAGLVQLRYHTNREDADRQVQQFFLDHPSTAEATTP